MSPRIPDCEVVVLIPVLRRPERIPETLWSLENGRGGQPYRAVFLASPNDTAELAALADAHPTSTMIVPWPPGPGDYARKINYGIRETWEPWIFVGADDLCYCPRWADLALAAAGASGARVIGVNDLIRRPRQHATHFLVARSYAEECGTIDGPGLLHEGYDHQYTDEELIGTARCRGEYHYAADAVVEHLHPFAGKAVTDEVYRKGQLHGPDDKLRFRARRPLWADD